MIIGKFDYVDGVYIGLIGALGGNTAVVMKPQERGPDYLVTVPDAGACGFRFNPAGCSDVKPAGIPI